MVEETIKSKSILLTLPIEVFEKLNKQCEKNYRTKAKHIAYLIEKEEVA